MDDFARYAGHPGGVPMGLRAAMTGALREQRQSRGLSLEQVGRKAGMARSAVHAIETGVTAAYLDRLEVLAGAVGARWVVTLADERASTTDTELQAACAALDPDLRSGLLEVVRAWGALSAEDHELLVMLSQRRARPADGAVVELAADQRLQQRKRSGA